MPLPIPKEKYLAEYNEMLTKLEEMRDARDVQKKQIRPSTREIDTFAKKVASKKQHAIRLGYL